MKKKLGVVLCSLFLLGITAYQAKDEILRGDSLSAATNDDFPAITFNQYAKFKISPTQSFTALNNKGSFLSNEVTTADPVFFPTTALDPITDSRNSSFITETILPKYADIYASIDTSESKLNANMPETETWWLNDTSTVNETLSARVIQKGMLNDASYVIKDSNNQVIKDDKDNAKYIWRGYLPIESKDYGNVRVSDFFNKDANSDALFHSIVGDWLHYTVGIDSYEYNIDGCGVKILDGQVMECSQEDIKHYRFTNFNNVTNEYINAVNFAAKVTLDHENEILIASEINPGETIKAGEIMIGWNQSNLEGEFFEMEKGNHTVFMVTLANDVTIPLVGEGGVVHNTEQKGGSFAALVEKNDYLGKVKDTTYGIYENVKAEPQKAHIRPKIKVDTSQIAYLIKELGTVNANGGQLILMAGTVAEQDVARVPVIKDDSLSITGLREQSGIVEKVDVTNRKIKIPKGTSVVNIPLTTSSLNEGYTRYISMKYNGDDTISNINAMYRLGALDSENGVVKVDLGSTMLGRTTDYKDFDYNRVGDKITIPLYTEDMADQKTGYISTTTYDVEIEVVESFGLTYEAKPGAINGQPSEIYKFNKNVLAGLKIGEVHLAGGAAPYTLALVDDDDNSGAYQYFELSETSGITSDNVDVRIKEHSEAIDTQTASLKAGTYNFCITSDDIDDTNPQQKTCESITVEKATPTIAFDTDNDGTTYVIGSATETTEYELHASYEGYVNGNGDSNIEYTKISGKAGLLLSGLPHTEIGGARGAILTFAPNTYGEIKVKAKIAGTDNYQEASTTKTINVISRLHGVYSQDIEIEPGTDSAKPQDYIEANRVAHVAISGGTAPYSYLLEEGVGENGSFHIDDKGNIYVNTSVGEQGLVPGEYPITITVSDQSQPSPQEIKIEYTIAVGVASANGFVFVNPDTNDQPLVGDTITATYNPENNGGAFVTKLVEVTEGALASTVITYELIPTTNDIVSLQANGNQATLTIQNATENGTEVKLKANVTGGIYGSETVSKEVNIVVEPYKQVIEFPDQDTVIRLPLGGECVAINAEITSEYHVQDEEILYSSSYADGKTPFTLNGEQQVCPTSDPDQAGSGRLRGHLNGNRNYENAMTEIEQNIEVYEPSNIRVTGSIEAGGTEGIEYVPDRVKLIANDSSDVLNGTAETNAIVAQIQDTESVSPTYEKHTVIENNPDNRDAELFNVNPDGTIRLARNITAADVIRQPNANIYRLQVNVTDDHDYTTLVNVRIRIDDALADLHFINPNTNAALPLDHVFTDGTTRVPVYTKTFETGGTIEVATNRTNITFNVHNEGDSSVLELSNRGNFTMLQASDVDGVYSEGGNTYVRACMAEGGGYQEQCIYTQVIVEKAAQTGFAFVNQPTWNMERSSASVIPTYINKNSSGDVTLTSSNTTVAEVNTPIKNQNQGFTLKNVNGATTLTATSPADRNYKVASASTTLQVTDELPETLSLQVPPMMYGDEHINVSISSGYREGMSTYFYTSDNTILETSTSAVSSDTSSDMKALGSGLVTIYACQTNEDFDPANDTCESVHGYAGQSLVTIAKKPITLTYDTKEVYTGEAFPAFTFQNVTSSELAFDDSLTDFIVPANTSIRNGNLVVTDTNTKGSYRIKGSYSTSESAQNVIKNYRITINDGTLNILQDDVQDSWIVYQNQTGDVIDVNTWQDSDISIALQGAIGDAGGYNEMSDQLSFTNTDKSKIIVNEEGEVRRDVYFRIDPTSQSAHAGAMTSTTTPILKIDKTAPMITDMMGERVNEDGVSTILNFLTLGEYFRPGVEIEVKAEDVLPTQGIKVSGLDRMEYQVYTLNSNGTLASETAIASGEKDFDSNGKVSVQMNEIGNYRMCVTAYDVAGNSSRETCSDIMIRFINVDVDGDGTLDFIDTNNDGYPDINIKWKDETDSEKWITLNIDTNDDQVPDMNIDSDGDGIADLNVDTNGDGIPDSNLVVMTKELWDEPTIVTTDQPEEYATGTDAEPQINIVLEGEQSSILNIDNRGDFKAHLNITTDSDKQKPIVNIVDLHEWNPTMTYTYQGFKYQSLDKEVKAQRNIDSNDNSIPDLSLDFDEDRVPEINVDTNGDGKPNFNIDIDGDGIADVNLDKIGDDGIPDEKIVHITTWEPNVNGTYRGIAYETMEITGSDQLENNGIIVQKPEEQFPIDYDLQVEDVTDQMLEDFKIEAKDLIGKNEIKHIYALKLLYNNVESALDDIVTVKIKIPDSIKNPLILARRSNGAFELVDAKIEDGYAIYQTNELGIITVLDQSRNSDDPSGDDKPIVNPDDPSGGDDPIVNPDNPSGGDDPIVNPDNPSGGDDPIVNPDNPSGDDKPIVNPDNPSGGDDPIVNPDNPSGSNNPTDTKNPNSNSGNQSGNTAKGTQNMSDSAGGANTGDRTSGLTYMILSVVSIGMLATCIVRKRKHS